MAIWCSDLCVEFLYQGGGAESVFFDNELSGDFSDFRYHVRDVTWEM